MSKSMEDDHDVNDEIRNFIKVWFYAILSLVYCYYVVSKLIPKGILRLIFLLPVFYLFTILPLSLNSLHLGVSSVFFLTWVGNFKLFLFSFNLGPLCAPCAVAHPPDRVCSSPSSSTDPSKSILLFLCLAFLPIRIKPNTSTTLPKTKEYYPYKEIGLQVLILTVLIRIYDHREFLHPNVILVFYYLHIYIGAEIALAISGALGRIILGQELEPPFDKPYLSSSLQQFWGRRWNLMVTGILRSTVYDPVCRFFTPVSGKTWAQLLGVFLAFVVSGVVHEAVFYYLTRAHPTWEVTWFFVLHGICTIIEVVIKKWLNTSRSSRWVLNRWVSRIMTVGFVIVTGIWLFTPQLIRNGVDTKVLHEYRNFGEYVIKRFHKFLHYMNHRLN
ncbi:hypothetical protein MKX03_014455 [Papaver bracteatum]|nr:hypothetical protein MKX03_014455 [Papaver bracteatum]